MEDVNISFSLDDDGNIIYDGQVSDDNLFGSENLESEIGENAEDVIANVDSGNLSESEMEGEAVDSEGSTETGNFDEISDSGDRVVSVALSDELTQALISSTTPAGGALTSSTLDYFDRVVGSLPSGYVYVAYRTDSDSSYNGVLYYGKNYSVRDDVVSFGLDARQVRVERVSSSTYNSYTSYKEYSAEDVVVNLSRSGDVIYYSNASVGYPILGGYDKPIGLSTYLAVGLVVAFAVAVLLKLIKR